MHGDKLWSLMTAALVAVVDPAASSTARTVEEAAGEALGRHGVAASAGDEAFLFESVAGASRFRHVCEGALQGYCDRLKRNKSDWPSMYLIAYLVIFRHAELGAERMRQLFHRSTPMPRLAEYLGYLMDPAAVRTCSVPLWLQTYDISFVEGVILRGLTTAWPIVRRVMESLADAAKPSPPLPLPPTGSCIEGSPASGAESLVISAPSMATIAPEAPALSFPRPCCTRLPPAEVREMAHTLPPPRRPAVKRSARVGGLGPSVETARQPKSPTKSIGFPFLEREKRTATTGVAATASPSPSPSPPPATLGFVAKDTSRVRAMLDKPVAVPTTNAAVRREAHLYQQRRAAEERALRELETNAHDSRAYDEWRQAELDRDARQREAQLLERHLAALQSEENIRAARAAGERQRRRVYRSMRQTAAEDARQQREAEQQRVEEQRGVVAGLRVQLERCRREAEERVAQERLRAAEGVKGESEEARRAVRAAEDQRRVEQAVVIQEIRLLRERVRQRRAELVEQRRNGGAADDDALLGGMTMSELQHELARVRAEEEAVEAERRRSIVAAKARESQERGALEEMCRKQRERRHAERELTRSVKEGKAAAARAAQQDAELERMAALQQKLEVRRRQRKAFYAATKEAERQRRNEANMRAVDDEAMERERWRQLELGAINRMNAAQAVGRK